MIKDEIIVYWGISSPEDINFSYLINYREPEPCIKELSFIKEAYIASARNVRTGPLGCPAIINTLKNSYFVPSPFNLDIVFKDKKIYTTTLNQLFYDTHINLELEPVGLFQLYVGYTLFTEEDELKVRLRGPSLSNTDISNNLITLEGEFDIGSWFRPLNCPYIFKKETSVRIKKNDPLFYIDFFTNKRIVFKKFFANKEIANLISACTTSTFDLKYYPRPIKTMLPFLYSEFKQSKIKKRILKLINDNLLD